MPRTGPTQLPAFLGDDATFRAWATGIHDALIALGAAQTADTGQLDIATAVRPGTASTFAGARLYRIGTAFLRVEFGVGGALDRPSLRVQLGSATTGAGALTGQVSAARATSAAASLAAGATRPLYGSSAADGSFLNLLNNFDASTNLAFGFTVEQSRGASAPDADGWFLLHWNGNAAGVAARVPASGTVPGEALTMPGGQSVDTFLARGADIPMWPVLYGFGKAAAMRSLLCYRDADLVELTPVAVAVGAESRTVMPMGDMGPVVGAGNARMAMAWDA